MSMMYLSGRLAAPEILRLVLAEEARVTPAVLQAADGTRLEAVTLDDPSSEAQARLQFYAESLGLDPVALRDAAGPLWHEPGAVTPLAVEIAREIMAQYGHKPAALLRARLGPIAVRADSRLRASTAPGQAVLRHQPLEQDVRLTRYHQPYTHFFAVEEYDLTFRRFDDSHSPVVNRAVFISGDAVTVLPYDPKRDRVLLIEQFRAGPYARGDSNPWSLEAIAGRIDGGETPEQAARREAVEEAGLELGALLPISNYYPSPGAKSEFIYSYVALTDLPDDAAGVFGVEGEAEDIRGHLVARQDLMALVASGEIGNGPLLVSVLWLELHHAGLRTA